MLAHQHVAGVLLELVSGMPVLMCDSPYPHSIRSKNPARDSPTTSGIFAFRFMSNAVLTGTGPNAKYCAAITPRQPLAQRSEGRTLGWNSMLGTHINPLFYLLSEQFGLLKLWEMPSVC